MKDDSEYVTDTPGSRVNYRPYLPHLGTAVAQWLTSKRCILYIYSTNIGTEYFKHALYSPFFFLFKMQFVSLVPVLFTFYI